MQGNEDLHSSSSSSSLSFSASSSSSPRPPLLPLFPFLLPTLSPPTPLHPPLNLLPLLQFMSLLLILPLRGRGWGHRHFDVVIITILFISKCQFHVNITTEWLFNNFSSANYSRMTLISHGNNTNFWNYYECNLCEIRVWTRLKIRLEYTVHGLYDVYGSRLVRTHTFIR